MNLQKIGAELNIELDGWDFDATTKLAEETKQIRKTSEINKRLIAKNLLIL